MDWKAVAQTYEQAYKEMADSFFEKLKEAAEVFNVPLVEYFDVDRPILLSELQGIIDRLKAKENFL